MDERVVVLQLDAVGSSPVRRFSTDVMGHPGIASARLGAGVVVSVVPHLVVVPARLVVVSRTTAGVGLHRLDHFLVERRSRILVPLLDDRKMLLHQPVAAGMGAGGSPGLVSDFVAGRNAWTPSHGLP